jgi:cytochrome c
MKLKHTFLTVASLAAGWLVSAPAMADLQLATSKNCMACHAVDKKLVGPSYKEVAAKYAGQADAVGKLEAKVLKGGAGVWGPVPMPANAQVTPAEAKQLVAWILAQK